MSRGVVGSCRRGGGGESEAGASGGVSGGLVGLGHCDLHSRWLMAATSSDPSILIYQKRPRNVGVQRGRPKVLP